MILSLAFIVFSYAGYSKKGYAPYNPRKRNQDALIMAEDPPTASLFLAVLDGHGEAGDKVAQVTSTPPTPNVDYNLTRHREYISTQSVCFSFN